MATEKNVVRYARIRIEDSRDTDSRGRGNGARERTAITSGNGIINDLRSLPKFVIVLVVVENSITEHALYARPDQIIVRSKLG